jgi:hypothetical protein
MRQTVTPPNGLQPFDFLAPVPYLEQGSAIVKLVTEYLEQAVKFDRMAAEATDPKLREALQSQAAAYRKLADRRAAQLNLPPVNLPAVLPKADGPP